MFAAAFAANDAKAPFHNNTCDGCHVRNGSGIPINTENKLDAALQEFMKGGDYTPEKGLHVYRANTAHEAGLFRLAP